MKIVITGAKGQLGQEMQLAFKSEKIFPFNKTTLDVTKERVVNEVVSRIKPDIIIHSAAYTNVEKAETEPEKAFETNLIGTVNIAKAAEKTKAQLLFLSTDYVFDGKKTSPYEVNDNKNPLNIYGLSKSAAEDAAIYLCEATKVIRISWLVGQYGNNFVNKMLQLASHQKQINVVNDQIGLPTFTADLVKTMKQLLYVKPGVYHVANQGCCSWYELARELYRLKKVNPDLVQPVSSEQYIQKARRPNYSVLSLNSLREVGVQMPRKWNDALQALMKGE